MPRKHNLVSKAPAGIEELISLINILPTDAKDFKAKFNEICDGSNRTVDESGNVTTVVPKCLMDERLVKYIFDREPGTEFTQRFEILLKAGKLFRKFAELSVAYMSLDKEKRNGLKDDPQLQHFFFLYFLTINYKDREFSGLFGFQFPGMYIKPVKDEFVQLFEDFDIPFFRIRSCPICGDIYWASKLNSETCGKKECSNSLGNQKRSQLTKKRF